MNRFNKEVKLIDLKQYAVKHPTLGSLVRKIAMPVIGLAALVGTGAGFVKITADAAERQASDFLNELRNSPTISCEYNGSMLEAYGIAQGLGGKELQVYTAMLRKENNIKPGTLPEEGSKINVIKYGRGSIDDSCQMNK